MKAERRKGGKAGRKDGGTKGRRDEGTFLYAEFKKYSIGFFTVVAAKLRFSLEGRAYCRSFGAVEKSTFEIFREMGASYPGRFAFRHSGYWRRN